MRRCESAERNDSSSLSHEGNHAPIARHEGLGCERYDEWHSSREQRGRDRVCVARSKLLGIVNEHEREAFFRMAL